MPVPKKRRKLDQSKAAKKTPSKAQTVEQLPVAAPGSNPKFNALSTRKLDKAFEIIDQIPSKEAAGVENPDTDLCMGFRWKIFMEAVMPDDQGTDANRQSGPRRSTVMDLVFTIPFFWGWPIIGEMTRSFFKNFQPFRMPDFF